MPWRDGPHRPRLRPFGGKFPAAGAGRPLPGRVTGAGRLGPLLPGSVWLARRGQPAFARQRL